MLFYLDAFDLIAKVNVQKIKKIWPSLQNQTVMCLKFKIEV